MSSGGCGVGEHRVQSIYYISLSNQRPLYTDLLVVPFVLPRKLTCSYRPVKMEDRPDANALSELQCLDSESTKQGILNPIVNTDIDRGNDVCRGWICLARYTHGI